MKLIVSTFLLMTTFLCCAASSFSLTTIPLFTTVKSVPKTMGISVPKSAGLFQNNASAFQALSKNSSTAFEVQSFPVTSSNLVDLEVTPFQILAPNATVCMGTAQGDVAINQNEATFLRGHVKGDPHSFVFLAVFEHQTSGYIEYTNKSHQFERVVVAPASIEKGVNSLMVVAQEEETNLRVHCETESMPNYHAQVKKSFELLEEYKKKSENPLNSQTLVSTIAVDCNHDFYKMHDSNLTQTVNYALTVMGAASAIFERDMNIIFQINYLRIWTVQDPFVGENNHRIFNNFNNYWYDNMQHIPRSFVKLISGSHLGGIANINTKCVNNSSDTYLTGTSLSGMEKNAIFPTKNFVGEMNTLTHEIGHNFGSPHTHSCEWGPPIDSCYSSSETRCYAGIKGSTGTIMSYCYLNPKFTRLNFHPRVAGLIRSIAESSPCLAINLQYNDKDLSIEQITTPISGSTIPPNTFFSPIVIVKNLGITTSLTAEISFFLSKREHNHRTNNLVTLQHRLEPLHSQEIRTIQFDSLSIEQEGDYQITFEVLNPEDTLTKNNIASIPIIIGIKKQEELHLESLITDKIYEVGDTFPISWKTTLLGDIRIDYSLDNGITWSPVVSRISAKEGKFNWIIPAQNTKKGKIKLSSFEESGIVDISDEIFEIEIKADVQPIRIVHPKFANSSQSSILNDTLVAVQTMVRNNALSTVSSFPIYLKILHVSSGAMVFYDSIVVSELKAQQEVLITFPKFRIPSGDQFGVKYSFQVWTNLDNDQHKDNDTIGSAFMCRINNLLLTSPTLKTPKNFGYSAFIPSVSWEIPENKREKVLIQIDTSRSFEHPIISEYTTDNYVTITKLPAGQVYYWRVQRLSNGVWSPIWQFQKLEWICNPRNGSCYTVVYAGSAEMARNQAKEMGANPLTIRSKEESNWIQSTFGREKTWLGYSNKGNSKKWYWYSNDETDYTNWGPNQPDNFNGKENCAVLLEDGTWDDIEEYFEYRSIFEISKKIAKIQNPTGGILAEIFPNPVSSLITIQFIQQQKDMEVSLFTSTGAKVFHSRVTNVKETSINVSDLAIGAYTLVLTSQDGTVSTSILVYR